MSHQDPQRVLERSIEKCRQTAVTDALIAAAAAEHGGLAVLHKDGHFDRLAEVLAFESVPLPVD